jgi:hypothetical protein
MSEYQRIKEPNQEVFNLTLALYRVTDFFPKGEPLRKYLRERANEIFGAVTEYSFHPEAVKGDNTFFLIAKIHSLKRYLDLAEALRFVNPVNLMVLAREYDHLALFFEKRVFGVKEKETAQNSIKNESRDLIESKETKRPAAGSLSDRPRKRPAVNRRQRTILDHLKRYETARVGDISLLFRDDGVSQKTLQRDLHDLAAKNLVKKFGGNKGRIYSLPQ